MCLAPLHRRRDGWVGEGWDDHIEGVKVVTWFSVIDSCYRTLCCSVCDPNGNGHALKTDVKERVEPEGLPRFE
jgi:hypothetical protein